MAVHTPRSSLKLFTSTVDSASPPPLSPRPMSAVTRRRLRANLPPSPVAAKPPAPCNPMPWEWRCCSCNTSFALSITRRCLSCSHVFCSVSEPPLKKRAKKQRRDHKGRRITCRTSFDYEGWSDYNNWRRNVTGDRLTEKQRDRHFLMKTHNDWSHCEYPSHCHQRRRELGPVWQDILLDSSDEELGDEKSRRSSTALSPDDELEMNEAVSLEKSEDPAGILWRMDNDKPNSISADASDLTDEQILRLLEEDNDLMPLEYRNIGHTPLTVHNLSEPDWGDSSSDSDSDDEDWVNADGNLIRAKGEYDQGPALLIKVANSFWSGIDF
ncbi:hypothetical protein SCUP234_10718 [Seiridium cupressi]